MRANMSAWMYIEVVNGWNQGRQILGLEVLGCKILNMYDNHKVDDFRLPLEKLDWHVYAANWTACWEHLTFTEQTVNHKE